MTDKCNNQVHIRWLPLLVDFGRYNDLSWGFAVLAWTYHSLCHAAHRDTTNIAGCNSHVHHRHAAHIHSFIQPRVMPKPHTITPHKPSSTQSHALPQSPLSLSPQAFTVPLPVFPSQPPLCLSPTVALFPSQPSLCLSPATMTVPITAPQPRSHDGGALLLASR
ncbi:hypothetical protein Ahy_A03g014786 [Arachis hypogaea]|uniref:Aminotransferase-like plant mobile domain-containing protein n=1 Tax=Arachis hypogaea TaxID=3818 RepID=A0A445DYR7_ARAHY|nr:hypothetical protein Ahy_A03g014786 [Arachis hypogaea]